MLVSTLGSTSAAAGAVKASTSASDMPRIRLAAKPPSAAAYAMATPATGCSPSRRNTMAASGGSTMGAASPATLPSTAVKMITGMIMACGARSITRRMATSK